MECVAKTKRRVGLEELVVEVLDMVMGVKHIATPRIPPRII